MVTANEGWGSNSFIKPSARETLFDEASRWDLRLHGEQESFQNHSMGPAYVSNRITLGR